MPFYLFGGFNLGVNLILSQILTTNVVGVDLTPWNLTVDDLTHKISLFRKCINNCEKRDIFSEKG